MADPVLNINNAQPEVSPDYNVERERLTHPEYNTMEHLQARWNLADMDGTMSTTARSVFGLIRDVEDSGLLPNISGKQSKILSIDELNKKYPHLSGTFKSPMSEANAEDAVALEEQKRRYEDIIDKSPKNFLNSALGLAADIGGGTDVADIVISSMIELPFVKSPVTRLDKSVNFFKQNLVESIVSEVPRAVDSQQQLRNYTENDALFNIAFGTIGPQVVYEGWGRGLKPLLESKRFDINKKIAAINEFAGKKPNTNMDFNKVDESAYVAPKSSNPDATISEKPFYYVDKAKHIGGSVAHVDTPFYNTFGGSVSVLVDNPEASINSNRVLSQADNVELYETNLNGLNIIDTTRNLDEVRAKPDANELKVISALEKQLGPEVTAKFKDAKNLQEVFEMIDEAIKNEAYPGDIRLRTGVKMALDGLSKNGIDGFSMKYNDSSYPTESVILIDGNKIDKTKVKKSDLKYKEDVSAKKQAEAFKDFRNDYTHDDEIFGQYKEIPDTFIKKTVSEVEAETKNQIKEMEGLLQSGRVSQADFDDMLITVKQQEMEMVATKLASACMGLL